MQTSKHPSTEALYCVGHWLLEHERFEDAKHVFRTMLLVEPADERGWLGLGTAHEGAWELEAAAHLYGLGRRACVTSSRVAIALGRVLRRMGRDASDAYADAFTLATDGGEEDLVELVAIEARAS